MKNIQATFVLHKDLENKIASLNKKEVALIFTSCYVATSPLLCSRAHQDCLHLPL